MKAGRFHISGIKFSMMTQQQTPPQAPIKEKIKHAT
jgi:hypothetical protein